MPYVDTAAIDAARQIDLLSYLQAYEPGELVHVSGSTYCTREHDSLKISNGKWHWFSRGHRRTECAGLSGEGQGDALPGGCEPADRARRCGLARPQKRR